MRKGKRHIPERTCISCGAKRAKHEFTRLSLDAEDQVVEDVSGEMHGRGAYVCKNNSCRAALSKNRRLNRLFRTDRVMTISPDLGIDG
ncbi:MAG: YlxR family protein [Deltaproteobacteria bacterium]|nr:YlxR family protein [Deltaproteobacteria bacterium]